MPEVLDCGGQRLDLTAPRIMGVLNVTPDSFSDGSRYYQKGALSIDLALRHAEALLDEGADIIDVGGESTRPGAQPVTEQEELDRVIPVIEAVSRRCPAIISIDTSTPQVMREAASAGAGLINDVRALTRPGALEAARSTRLPVSLMHMQGQPVDMQEAPRYQDVQREILTYLRERTAACLKAGIQREQILIDPGFGFGKSLQHNLKLLSGLAMFAQEGLPVVVGLSRKSMLGDITQKPISERLHASIAAAAIAVFNGANIVRCHDVAATLDAVRVAWATRQSNRDE